VDKHRVKGQISMGCGYEEREREKVQREKTEEQRDRETG
jgi:hypothetical protein